MAASDKDEFPVYTNHPVFGGIATLGYNIFAAPAIWFNKKLEAIRGEPQAFYHRRYPRVPTIDECYRDDVVCRFEANQQFMRDKLVEGQMIDILRQRFNECVFYEKGSGMSAYVPLHEGAPVDVSPGSTHQCRAVLEAFEKANENFFIKYGELGKFPTAEQCYLKQKHRLMWERRHGPVGTGMKTDEPAASQE
eukprot:TRINITY_DN2697_c0_g1_i1.p1 TRINITY_DN2697_c0_g1~~TRINITY_DN2697_c0_g1_i1.p1  ORF type:complete len:193 (-),score=25.48 TRINITY_DN2697_c0_g1_i1:171-749(-)